jgi:uncharacterized protein with LGFP repeats
MSVRVRRSGRWSHGAVVAAVLVGVLTAPGQAAATTPIAEKYAAMGGEAGVLGSPLGPEACGLRDDGCVQEFAGGDIAWSPATGAHAVTDPDVHAEWVRLGAEEGPGYPTRDTFCGLINNGCGQHFQRSSVYSSGNGTFAVDVAMLPGWAAASWEGRLGYPVDERICGLRDGGCLQEFENGMVYLTSLGSFAVWDGWILEAWADQGWEHGGLGYPTSSTFGTRAGGTGQHFEGGSVYWSSTWGTSVLARALRDRWGTLGWEYGMLGDPVGSTFCGLRDGGCGQHFRGGSLYSSRHGTFAVGHQVLSRWAASGWEYGGLGYPTSDTFCSERGCGQHFEGGSLYRGAAQSVVLVLPQIRDKWGAAGAERGPLGWPRVDTFCGLRDGGCGQHFSGGSIYWSPGTGARFVTTSRSDFARPLATRWEQSGWEFGALGYPTSDPFCGLRDGGCGQHFQGGSLYYTLGRPAMVVSGPIRDRWAALGWERGHLGYPTSDARPLSGGWLQTFQGGTLRLVDGRVS